MQHQSRFPKVRWTAALLALLIATSLAASGCQLGRRRGADAAGASTGAAASGEASGAAESGNPGASESPADTAGASGSPADSGATGAGAEEVTLVDTVPDPVPLELEPIAAVAFELDDAKTVERACESRNGGTLSVVDAKGTTWTLTIPPFALVTSQTIRMTPVASMTMDGGPSLFHGGVVLEPDGLAFLLPARMTVVPAGDAPVPAGDDREPILLSGTYDGSLLEWIFPDATITRFMESSDTSAKASGYPVMHFSSLVFTDRGTLREQKTIPGLAKEAEARLAVSVALAKAYLKEHKKSIDVLAPPAYPIACQTKEDQKSLDEGLAAYIDKARAPESELVQFLLHDLQALSLVETVDITTTEAYELARILLWRNERKADELMKQYRGQPDFLLPVSLLALRAASDSLLLGPGSEGYETLSSRIWGFMQASIKPMLEDLRVNHNYRQMRALVRLAVFQGVLGMATDNMQPYIDQIAQAMRFELELNVHYITPDSDYGIFGIFPLRYDDMLNYMQGKNAPGFTHTTSVPDVTMSGTPDTTSIIVPEFNPCEGKGRFSLDRFWATGEVMTIEDEAMDFPLTERWWKFSYADYRTDTGEGGFPGMVGDALYSFPFEVRNGQEIAAEGEVKGKHNAGGKMDITFSYRLRHTPK